MTTQYDGLQPIINSEYVIMAQYGNNIPMNIAQLAPQYRLLDSNEAVSSIQRPVKWKPPVVSNVAFSYPSTMSFGQEMRIGDPVLWHEFANARFYN